MAVTTTSMMCRLIVIFSIISLVFGRKHRLRVENDQRSKFDMSTFGFMKGGFLQVQVKDFKTGLMKEEAASGYIGFTLSRMESAGMSSVADKDTTCLLTKDSEYFVDNDLSVLAFKLDFKTQRLMIERKGLAVQNLTITTMPQDTFDVGAQSRKKRSVHEYSSDSYLLPRRKRDTADTDSKSSPANSAAQESVAPTIRVTIPAASSASSSSSSSPSSASLPKPSLTDDKTPEDKTKSENQSTKLDTADKSKTDSESKGKPDESKGKPDESKGKPDESKGTLDESKGMLDESKGKPDESKGKPDESKGMLDEDKSKNITGKSGKLGTDKPVVPAGHVITANYINLTVDNRGVSFMFAVLIEEEDQSGLYKFAFRNCYNYDGQKEKATVNFTVFLIERNDENYLSAGHIPLPTIYFILSVIFFVLACFWLYILKKATEGVYKIHYLMLTLVYIKSLALFFHAVNYHFLATEGHHEEAIAIIYYITYLMRGILLFVAIVLIGAGWAFVKHILSDRDKKIFLIIIPFQVLANIAQIITQETEEGESDYITWSQIFIIVDLLCCGAILFPIVWSIRHLQEASHTDGKAAINLVKLKLFRHFYILIVCYIYFTRIIVYLLRIAVPFEYEWLDELFREAATLIFYIITGYKFRPASDNPYLQVPQDSDDEVEMDEVLTQSGVLEGITKVNVKSPNGDSSSGVSKRESSHEYD